MFIGNGNRVEAHSIIERKGCIYIYNAEFGKGGKTQ